MYSETSIEVQIPRIVRSFGNDIDYPPDGTWTIQRRGRAFHYFHSFYIVQVEAVVVYVIQCFSGQTFAIYQKEDGITAKSLHVELYLLIHWIRELDTR